MVVSNGCVVSDSTSIAGVTGDLLIGCSITYNGQRSICKSLILEVESLKKIREVFIIPQRDSNGETQNVNKKTRNHIV